MDFSSILSIFDAFTIVAAVTAIAALKILPGVARWGFSQVIAWFSVGGVLNADHHKQVDAKKRSGGVRSAAFHPGMPKSYMKPGEMTDIYKQMQAFQMANESNLEPESRFRVFGAIFGFFSGFFTRFFSFFYKKK